MPYLVKFVSVKNLTSFLLWENLLCFQTGIIQPRFLSSPSNFLFSISSPSGVKTLSSAHQALTPGSPWRCLMRPSCLSKKELYILKCVLSDYYPSPFKQKAAKGKEIKKRTGVCSHLDSVGIALSCLSDFEYSPGLSKICFLTLPEKSSSLLVTQV